MVLRSLIVGFSFPQKALKWALAISMPLFILGCKTLDKGKLSHPIKQGINFGEAADNYFQGILVYDPLKKDTLYRHNSKKYFIPASNTKIFTLFAALKTLPDKIPSLHYAIQNDTLFMEGTGDPTFLHPYFKDSTFLRFAEPYAHISLSLSNFKDTKFGPGWAWEDYDRYYHVERSGFPIYGNVVDIHKADSIQVAPSYFRDKVLPLKYIKNREWGQNIFYFDPDRKDSLEIPFIVDSTLVKKLLEAALHKKIHLVPQIPNKEKQTLHSIPSDALYKRMMHESDNFLAEQLLILISATLSDTLNSATARAHITNTYLTGLRQPPKWVDGSGLSRYNLFTPESMVYVLDAMYREIPRERLLDLFPAGGVSGTLKNRFGGDGQAYIFAKSGAMGNTYNLSGYLMTRSGKTLIFSFMNNHFIQSSQEVRQV
ncbi:MAG TPA: D-alanyl-D-alanine carboxypeptidase, partial [Arenibacter sp.]|nr:D-alanyl-D-alanine carboxypeptidase [Arenibacter sp.]